MDKYAFYVVIGALILTAISFTIYLNICGDEKAKSLIPLVLFASFFGGLISFLLYIFFKFSYVL